MILTSNWLKILTLIITTLLCAPSFVFGSSISTRVQIYIARKQIAQFKKSILKNRYPRLALRYSSHLDGYTGLVSLQEFESLSTHILKKSDHFQYSHYFQMIPNFNSKVTQKSPKNVAGELLPWGVNKVLKAKSKQRGSGIKICLVDSGVDSHHPDIQHSISGGRNFIPNADGTVNPNAWLDDNGHGSHMAGIMVAAPNGFGTVGVAPKANIFAVKVLDHLGRGNLIQIAEAILECVAQKAQIINISLGGPANAPKVAVLETAVKRALQAGIIVVVAAGNEGRSVNSIVPAKFAKVIRVGAMDFEYNVPSFSNRGLIKGRDFVAPGVSIYSTIPNGRFAKHSGTSQATSHVSALFALALSEGDRIVLGVKPLSVDPTLQGSGFLFYRGMALSRKLR